MTLARTWLKLGVLVVAMLAAVGAWEIYKGTVKLPRAAYAQNQENDLVQQVDDIHRVVVRGDGPLFPRALHFKCYQITPGGPALNAPVTVFDQFHPAESDSSGNVTGGEHVTVRVPHLLCTPALKIPETGRR